MRRQARQCVRGRPIRPLIAAISAAARQVRLIVIHVSDHDKPMKLTSATGKVTVLNGSGKTEAPLARRAARAAPLRAITVIAPNPTFTTTAPKGLRP